MDIQFLGAVGTVTGSKYLLTTPHKKILVDCGLFQGLKNLRLRNWSPLPFYPNKIDALLVTHAHIDHTGYIPLLVKQGFRGPIYCSEATFELCKILLRDSGMLQEEDAEFANKHGFSKHSPALPLYTQKDAETSLNYFHPLAFNTPFDLGENLHFTFLPAGHILGASFISLTNGKISLLFSGDMGRSHDIIMNPPTPVEQADYLILESTYGDRKHNEDDPKKILKDIVLETAKKGGTLVIPSFAVGRAQTILYLLSLLRQENEIPPVPIYVDSPMATNVTELYCRFSTEHNLPHNACVDMCKIARFVNTPQESKELDLNTAPKIIITASGMATGGRVLHHLKAFIGDPKNTIFFIGFQAAGTRGASLVGGAQEIKIHGQYFSVRAKILKEDSLSAHADYTEILSWLKNFKSPPKEIFLTHGEPIQADALRLRIQDKFKFKCIVPEYLETFELK
ncbi:MAG: MBL fold metallo-hydrolase [Alphaproteobacteria bacterium 16-39-46]|nr:MAG: MBL fold metallo-hydrolase [Alphaproteobacteria bacterium 16-39-46]OZA44545.1 MAG: MBL fold metallo-hydrolase [Alphaproteobacteria bacterium 17-39-52]HQS83394.1 MBL fold metallo-hydrolase [Alphaproteobacteria bacterium]HQS93081.1 MBL fold metallo-hydrolase [Alphaproteobacteria bacterium]